MEFLDTLNEDPWGRPYRLVTNRLKSWSFPLTESLDREFLQQTVATLFPVIEQELRSTPEGNTIAPRWMKEWEVCETEMVRAVRKMGGITKTPGPDHVPGIVLKLAVGSIGEHFRETINACLRGGCFPCCWKRSIFVLIHKDGKPEDLPSSYRPICLLDELSKTLERVIAGRVNRHLKIRGPKLSPRQYGFRERRSTVDAVTTVRDFTREETEQGGVVLTVSLDIANAFNSLRWSWIRRATEDFGLPEYLRRIIDGYLSDRTIEWSEADGRIHTREMSCGVPQGSALGPLLWTLAYDRVVRTHLPPAAPWSASQTTLWCWRRGTTGPTRQRMQAELWPRWSGP